MLGTEGIAEENADVLRRMTEDGDDLTQSRDIDFNHLFAREEDAIAFQEMVRGNGYSEVMRDFWPEESSWLTTVAIRMVPELEAITATELALNEIALPLDGRPDGWGCVELIATETS